MLNTQPDVGYSAGYFRVRPENVINKNLPTEYASTANQSIHYQKPSRNKHRDRGPRQFTTDCRSAVRRSSRGGDHCHKGRYLRGAEIPDGQDQVAWMTLPVRSTYDPGRWFQSTQAHHSNHQQIRVDSLFPFSGPSLKKPFCQPCVNFPIGRMALHSGPVQ
jgi:hypothetical protein